MSFIIHRIHYTHPNGIQRCSCIPHNFHSNCIFYFYIIEKIAKKKFLSFSLNWQQKRQRQRQRHSNKSNDVSLQRQTSCESLFCRWTRERQRQRETNFLAFFMENTAFSSRTLYFLSSRCLFCFSFSKFYAHVCGPIYVCTLLYLFFLSNWIPSFFPFLSSIFLYVV